jgi:hypothetical protein
LRASRFLHEILLKNEILLRRGLTILLICFVNFDDHSILGVLSFKKMNNLCCPIIIVVDDQSFATVLECSHPAAFVHVGASLLGHGN